MVKQRVFRTYFRKVNIVLIQETLHWRSRPLGNALGNRAGDLLV
jgi:hypothetical protein